MNDLKLNAIKPDDDDEAATVANIQQCQDEIQELVKKERKLSAIKAKCDDLGNEHDDVKQLTAALSDQLAKTNELIRRQLIKSKETIHILEIHLIELREKGTAAAAAANTPTPSESDTIDSSPMPEHDVPPRIEQRYEVETQTSESLQVPRPPPHVVTVECSVQTKDLKPTENICVTQTQSEGHETIKFETAPNPNVDEHQEDVFVDAKYKQPNEPHKATELILRNVPQTAFETIFVEPDNTTTEVVVDADGRKQIIVRKVTRTVQQQQIVQQKQQHTKIESVLGADNEPIEQNVTQSSTEDHSTVTSVSDGKGSKTVKTKKTKITHAAGESPDQLVIQEVIEQPTATEVIEFELPALPPSIGALPVEHSSVQTVTHHVTQRIIRRKKKIIRKVTIIDGKEHVTEEVIEEPEEVEITEDDFPGVNINVMQFSETTPIVEMPADDERKIASIEQQIISEPMIIAEREQTPPTKSSTENQGKKVRASKKVKEEQNTQVLDFDASAPVDLVDYAPVVAALHPIASSICDVNIVQLPAQEEIKIAEPAALSPVVQDISEIWPTNEPSIVSLPSHETSVHESISQTVSTDSIPSEKIWPIDDKTGHVVTLETYTYEPAVSSPITEQPKPTQTNEMIISEEISQPVIEEPEIQEDVKDHPQTMSIEITRTQISDEIPIVEVVKSAEKSDKDSGKKEKDKKKKSKKDKKQPPSAEKDVSLPEQRIEIHREITVERKSDSPPTPTTSSAEIQELPSEEPKQADSALFLEQERYDVKLAEPTKPSKAIEPIVQPTVSEAEQPDQMSEKAEDHPRTLSIEITRTQITDEVPRVEVVTSIEKSDKDSSKKDKDKQKKSKKDKKQPPSIEKDASLPEQHVQIDEKSDSPPTQTVSSIGIDKMPTEEPQPADSALFLEQERYDVKFVEPAKPSEIVSIVELIEKQPTVSEMEKELSVQKSEPEQHEPTLSEKLEPKLESDHSISEPTKSESSSKTFTIEKDKDKKKKKSKKDKKKGLSTESDGDRPDEKIEIRREIAVEIEKLPTPSQDQSEEILEPKQAESISTVEIEQTQQLPALPAEQESTSLPEQYAEIRRDVTVEIEKSFIPHEIGEKSESQPTKTLSSIEVQEIPIEEPKPADSALFLEQERYDVNMAEPTKPTEIAEPAVLETIIEAEKTIPIPEPQPEPQQTSSQSEKSEKSSKPFAILKNLFKKDKSKKKKKDKKGTSSEEDSKTHDESPPPPEVTVEITTIEKAAPEKVVEEEKPQTSAVVIETVRKVIEKPIQPIDPIIVIDEPQASAEILIDESQTVAPPEEESKLKPIDVRSVTQLFIANELNVSDGTTRTVKLTMSPQQPLSPGSVQVKMDKIEAIDQQPKLNVNLVEERTDIIQPIDPSVVVSTDIDVTDDDKTISDQLEMPEIETTPIPTENIGSVVVHTERLANISPDETYKTISELEGAVKIVEECVISPDSDSPKPLGAEIVIATEILEEQHTENAEQQTEPVTIGLTGDKPTESSCRSMQTTPEPVKIDEELQTSPTKPDTVTDTEVQTTPVKMADDIEKVSTINEEVWIFDN